MNYKKCSHCGQTLPITNFYISSRALDGRQSYCKACMKLLTYKVKDDSFIPRKRSNRNDTDFIASLAADFKFLNKKQKKVLYQDLMEIYREFNQPTDTKSPLHRTMDSVNAYLHTNDKNNKNGK
jgi:recombinational DNA repair protein (RecF pathway)